MRTNDNRSAKGSAKPVRLDIDWGEEGSPFAEFSSLGDSVRVSSRSLRIDPTWTDRVLDMIAGVRAVWKMLRELE